MWKFQSKPKLGVRKVELNSLQRREEKRGHRRKGKKNQERERVRTTLLFNLLLDLKSRFGSVVRKWEMLFSQKSAWLGHVSRVFSNALHFFPALCAGHVFFGWVFIGSLCCLSSVIGHRNGFGLANFDWFNCNWIVIVFSETPSTMSPPHSMFISESVDGQAKPEPMNEDYTSRPQGSAKVSWLSTAKTLSHSIYYPEFSPAS